jgi:phosphoribosylformylglycinamidine (FGAM) synthase PurS component
MSGKITKLRMWGAINFHFDRIGQRIRCVEKLRKRELEEIIAQYNINIDEEYAIRAESDRIALQERYEKIEKIKTTYLAILYDEGKEKFKENIKEIFKKKFKNPFQEQYIYDRIFENL